MKICAAIRTLLLRWLCLIILPLVAVAAQEGTTPAADSKPKPEQIAAVNQAKGLNGSWRTSFMFKGHKLESIFTFNVDSEATPPPEVRVRFTGSLRGTDASRGQGVHFIDGEIIGNQFSFTSYEKAGKEWKMDMIVSVYVGSFDGDQIKMVYLNTEPRDPAGPNRVQPGPHRIPPPGGDFNMHVLTGHRVD